MRPQLDTAKVVEVFKGAVADTAEKLDQVYDALWIVGSGTGGQFNRSK